MLASLHHIFSELRGEEVAPSNNTWAKKHTILVCLRRIFENSVNILDPETFSHNAYEFLDSVEQKCIYINNEIGKILSEDKRELKKPIVALWSTNRSTEMDTPENIHWQTLVILPKNYSKCIGKPLNNQSEILLFKDSQTGALLPENVRKWFIRASSSSLEANSRSIKDPEIKYLFTSLEIHDTDISDIKQQLSECDNGWWALYNACMFVMEGSSLFLNKFKTDTSLMKAVDKLKAVFLDIFSRVEPKNEYEGIQEVHKQDFGEASSLQLREGFEIVKKRIPPPRIPEDSDARPGISTGESEFITLVTSGVFVDKTLFIKHLTQDKEKRIIITRPRRWGKSLAMGMVNLFFSPYVDNQGNFNLEHNNKHYALFAGGEYTSNEGETFLLQSLKITKEADGAYLKLQGQYPVLYLSFKACTKEEVINQTFSSLRECISDAYKAHYYLVAAMERQKLHSAEHEKRRIQQRIERFEKYREEDPQIGLGRSILFLAELLYEHFHRKVIVIIDEFDSPITSQYDHDPEQRHLENTKDILNNIYVTAFKIGSHNYYEKVILIGILPIVKGNLFAGLNNFTSHGVRDPMYSSDFGFSDEEVSKLIEDKLHSTGELLQNQMQQVRNWYNGYCIGEIPREYSTLYNPWSVMTFLKDAGQNFELSLKPYWIDARDPQMIENTITSLKFENELKYLMKYNKPPCLVASELGMIKNSGEFFCLLLLSGYLTKEVGGGYRIPNFEVRSYFYENLAKNWIRKIDSSQQFNTNSLIRRIFENIERFDDYIGSVEKFLQHISTEEVMIKADFQILLGGIALLNAKINDAGHTAHAELSNKYNKRLNAIFYPKERRSNTIIINKYKKANSFTNIESTIENGLWRIYANKYLSQPLDFIRFHNITPWDTIATRVIVFYRNTQKNEWNIRGYEIKHSIAEAIRIDSIFSSNGEILSNYKKLIGVGKIDQIDEARRQFLEKNQANTIYELLSSNPQSILQEISPGSPRKRAKSRDDSDDEYWE